MSSTIINSAYSVLNVEYYHLECKDHYTIYANGVLSEKYFDANNRGVFV